jgi:hypothetical protein
MKPTKPTMGGRTNERPDVVGEIPSSEMGAKAVDVENGISSFCCSLFIH